MFQLDDGTEIIIALMRLNNYLWIYDTECDVVEKDFKMKALNTWVSPETGCQYATSWKVSFDEKEYLLETVHQDGEMVERFATKYETPIVVSGSEKGRGFVEIMGTC